MLNKGQVWRTIQARLNLGENIRTWSERDGFGPLFRIDRINRDVVLVTPESTGKQRRLVQNSFNEVVDYLNARSARSDLSTRNSSYTLGILKHLGFLDES